MESPHTAKSVLDHALGDLDTLAQENARSIIEKISRELTDPDGHGITDDDLLAYYVRFEQPALMWRLYKHLARELQKAAAGWEDVFLGNLSELP